MSMKQRITGCVAQRWL